MVNVMIVGTIGGRLHQFIGVIMTSHVRIGNVCDMGRPLSLSDIGWNRLEKFKLSVKKSGFFYLEIDDLTNLIIFGFGVVSMDQVFVIEMRFIA